jgi:FAD/FMN-containing dehydrogenase
MPTPLEELKSIVGPRGWSTDPAELEPFLTERRGAVRGEAAIMLAPATPTEVSQVVAVCARERIGVVPQGGNTGLCGGAVPDASGTQVLLRLGRLNAVRGIDADNFSITVEAGCILADVQAAARCAGLYFPLSLSPEGSCQIGGNLSTNAGGINVVRYGTARQQVLGLEVVLADGTIWDGLRALRKDTAGYDMKQLFLGSEGTLGIITAATLALHPDPGPITTAVVALESAAAAVTLLARMRGELADRIQAFELMSDRCLRFVHRHIPDTAPPFDNAFPWYVLLDAAVGDEQGLVVASLAAAIETGLAADAIVAKNSAEAERLWRQRHSISEAQRHEGASLKHDVAVPVAAIREFLERAGRLVEECLPGARRVTFGHVGDGNLHYNVSQPEGADPAAYLAEGRALTLAIYDLVCELGGTISAEHGIGVTKKADLARYRNPVEVGLMRSIKKALDPLGILNPGKVI